MIRINRINWIAGTLLVLLSVIGEALGSHLLKESILHKTYYALAMQFLMGNGLGLILSHLLYQQHRTKLIFYSGLVIGIGTLLFSTTLFMKSLGLTGDWGILTPIGGAVLIAGWVMMVTAAFRSKY
jgi:uncharacterized membrane protein YgdD (TMEM256/DUF423 family)